MTVFHKGVRSLGTLLVAIGLGHVAAAQVKHLSTEELTRQADLVVVGKVTGMQAGWNSDRSRIYTSVTVTVDQTLKGNGGPGSASILVPGGEVDGVGELYSHSVQFKKDEEVVVFARKDKLGRLRVVAGEHGKLSVSKDAATGARFVSGERPLTELTQRVKAAAGEVMK